jgi:cytochrome P450
VSATGALESNPGSTLAGAAALPPGPGLPAGLQTLGWILAPTVVMDRCRERFGDPFTITLAPRARKLVLFGDPDAVRTIFTASPEIAPSAAGDTPLTGVMGPSSVLTLVGPAHLRQRRLLLPPFHGERMREYAGVIEDAARRDMAGWPIGRAMRIHPHMQAITLEVILRAVFGVEAERMGTMREAVRGLIGNSLRAVLRIGFTASTERPGGRLGEALERLDSVIYEELARRRTQVDLEERADILSLLLLARDEDGRGMTDGELRDELVTLLLAGHETTATAVSWAIERLVRHPAVLRRLFEEIDDRKGEGYLEAVVHETLRVRPVVPTVVRRLTQPLEVGGRVIPAGTRVAPSIYLTNRNPSVYDAPREFRPERFLGVTPDTYAWIPFGGGIRRCIGASFALMEMKIIMRTVLSELEPVAPGGRLWRVGEPVRRRAVTLAPALGGRVVWRSRRA